MSGGKADVRSRSTQWKIAVYIRLSREDGGDESLSVANQRKIIQEFVETDFMESGEVIDEYVDDGATGTDYERPEFQRLLRDIERGRVNCVICKTLARAFRNYSDQGYFLEHFFPRYGVRFITLGEPKIDSFLDPERLSGYEVPISGIMNDRYAGRTSMDVRRTFDMKRRKGEFIGSFAPYGYRKDPEDKNHLLVDEEAARTVREIFAWFLMGTSKLSIARRLNGLGVPNPSAYKRGQGLRYSNPQTEGGEGLWGVRTISNILQNQMYIGTMVQGKQRVISYKVHDRIAPPEEEWFVVPGKHQPIVDEQTFWRVQELCRRTIKTQPGKGEPSLFSGLVFCGGCGKAMSHNSVKGYQYYRCRTRKEKGTCAGRAIRFDRLEQGVLAAVRRQIGEIHDLERLHRVLAVPASEQGAERIEVLLKKHKREIGRLRELADGLYPDWKAGELTKEEYHRMKEKLTRQQERLERGMEQLKKEYGAKGKREEDLYLNLFLRQGNIEHLERDLLLALIHKVVIYEGTKLQICFRFSVPKG